MNADHMTQLAEKFPNFVIFQTATGNVNIDVFFQNETLWLTQKSLAELFEVKVPAVSRYLKNIFDMVTVPGLESCIRRLYGT